MVALSKLLLSLAALAVSVAATSLGISSRVTRASARSVPHGWSLHRRAEPDTVLPLKFTLAQSNLDNLDAYLLDIADPHSPNYGKHWSSEKVVETFRPSKESVDTVHSWLVDDLGLDPHKVQINRDGGAVQLDVTIAEAEHILGAEYYVYRFGEGGDSERIGCHEGYSLPEHVSKHVDFVSPTIHLGRPRLTRRDGFVSSTPGAGQAHAGPRIKKTVEKSELEAMNCDQAVTLDCLRGLYNFESNLVSGKKNSIAVAEFEEEIFQQSDLNLFFQTYEPSLNDYEPIVISIENGTIAPPGDFGEATLDIELVMGLLGPKQNLTVYQVGQTSSLQQPIDELLAAFDAEYCDIDPVNQEGITDCGNKQRANVVSISYHFEPDYLDPTITPIVLRECTEIGKLSLTGMTFVASSGDGGVAYSQAEGCLVNGTLQFFTNEGSFVGQFPASCPYVTAVGATSVAPGNSVKDPETATTAFPSGGGFSNNFARPAWQDAVVSNYIKNFAPAYGPDIYNRSGRAYPDVATNGFPTVIFEGGGSVITGGTSASAPIFAAFVAAINDARLAEGKKPVGWVNPALYSSQFANAYNDVTNGTNPGCGTEGFPAAPGWDPITGLGTPNFPKLLKQFLALP